MKQLVGSDIGSYTFDPSTRQITLLNIISINTSNVLVITNIDKKETLYNFADDINYISINNNTITLSNHCTGMSSTDKLQIWLDLNIPHPNQDVLYLINRLVKICEPIMTQDTNQRQRVVVDAAPTTTVTIATTGGANVTGIGYPSTTCSAAGSTLPGTMATSQPTQLVATIVDQRWEMIDRSKISFNTGIRSKLTWS